MITFVTAEDNKTVAAVDNGTELKRWVIGSKDCMISFIKKNGAEKFDLSATEIGKVLFNMLNKVKNKPAKAPKTVEIPADAKVEAGTEAAPAAEVAPAPTAEVADDGMVEHTYVTSEGDSVTIVHPANPA